MKYSFIVPSLLKFIFFISAMILVQDYGLAQKRSYQIPDEVLKAFNDKNYKLVIDQLSLKTDTLDSDGIILLGKAYSESSNPLAAIKTYIMALSKKDKNFEAKTLIGREYVNLKKNQEALVNLKEALDWNPKYEPAYIELERMYSKKNNNYELRALYIDMIKNIGEKAEYVTKLCESSYRNGLFESSTSYCRRGIILAKEEPKNYVYLGVTFKETGKIKEAYDLLKRAADNFDKSYEAQFLYAKALEDQKNYIESQKYYRRAHEISPQTLEAIVGYASTTVELQKFQDGLDLYKKACDINKRATLPLRKSIISLKGFKAAEYVQKYENLSDICGLTGP